MRRIIVIVVVALVAVVASVAPGALSAGATSSTLLRLRGIGPLTLGMTRAAALGTGWLAGRGTGCPLGGPPLPITYRLSGPRAPSGLRGTVEFDRGRLGAMSFTGGVRTATGVTVGRTTTRQMVSRYRRAGFTATARFEQTFAGTFVTVSRGGRQVIGAFATRGPIEQLAIPSVQVCE